MRGPCKRRTSITGYSTGRVCCAHRTCSRCVQPMTGTVDMAQVNVACRASALAPGVADSLAAFAGVYCSHCLPDIAGKPADAGPELAISISASGAVQPEGHLRGTCKRHCKERASEPARATSMHLNGCGCKTAAHERQCPTPCIAGDIFALGGRGGKGSVATAPEAAPCCMRAGQPAVSVNGSTLSAWTFDAMNVLSWADGAGGCAWLQLMVLPGGPVFMGTLAGADAEAVPGAHRSS